MYFCSCQYFLSLLPLYLRVSFHLCFSFNSLCITSIIVLSLSLSYPFFGRYLYVPDSAVSVCMYGCVCVCVCLMPSLVKLTAHSTPSNCFTQIYLTSIYLPVFVLILICIHSPFFFSSAFDSLSLHSRRMPLNITTLTVTLVNNDVVF